MGINDTTKQIPTFLNVLFNILDNNIHPVIQNNKKKTLENIVQPKMKIVSFTHPQLSMLKYYVKQHEGE